MPSPVTSPISPQDVATFSNGGDEEFLDVNERDNSIEDQKIISSESAQISPDEMFSQWFGRNDATTVSFYGELREPENGNGPELCIDGTPLRELLEPEDLPYYEHVFLSQLREGRAAWQGEELPNGTIREGCIATRRGGIVELTYGSQAFPGGEAFTPPDRVREPSRTFPPNNPSTDALKEEPTVVSLDDALLSENNLYVR